MWNAWRAANPDVRPDLSEKDLSGADLVRADLHHAILHDAILRDADMGLAILMGAELFNADLCNVKLVQADMSGAVLNYANLHMANMLQANLHGTYLVEANLNEADLRKANLIYAHVESAILTRANLSKANLSHARFIKADLTGANLQLAILNETDLTKATLVGCRVYGISAWDVKLDGAIQSDLIISQDGKPEIKVNDLEVAQFIYLFGHSKKIDKVVDTMSSKSVLILGRFSGSHKAILDAISEKLPTISDYIPIIFDVTKPKSRDLTETIRVLAHLSHFVIADMTNAKSIPHELMSFVPFLPSVPVQPIILKGRKTYSMFRDHLERYPWVLSLYEYESEEQLLADLDEKIIRRAEKMAANMRPKQKRDDT